VSDPRAAELRLTTDGEVPREVTEYALAKVERVRRLITEPILSAEVRLRLRDRSRPRPAMAEAELDLNGQRVRAQVSARDMFEAVDLLEARLRGRVDRHRDRQRHRGRDALHNGEHPDHEWRHEWRRVPVERPDHYDRPVEEREVLRRQTFDGKPMTVDEATYDAGLLGHDFYLFTELHTGADSCVHPVDDGVELRQIAGGEGYRAGAEVVAVQTAPPPPALTENEAIERLELGGERFVFFQDVETGRGAVACHRYDGHYGVLTLG
jgi:ribosomal subunit interface protein